MAVTVTPVYAGTTKKTFTVVATADGDTTAVVNHNFGTTPETVVITPLLDAGHTSRWFVSAKAANSVTLTKGTGVGSGNAGAQIEVLVQKIHTITG